MEDPHDEHNIWNDEPTPKDKEPVWLWVAAAVVFITLVVLLVGYKP